MTYPYFYGGARAPFRVYPINCMALGTFEAIFWRLKCLSAVTALFAGVILHLHAHLNVHILTLHAHVKVDMHMRVDIEKSPS